MEITVPYADLTLLNNSVMSDIMSNIEDCIVNNSYIEGKWVNQFEQDLADYLHTPTVGVRSCSAAQLLLLNALGIGSGDEVIVPSMTFISTADSVTHAGAKPVFADIDLTDYCIDIQDCEQKITSRTRAIVAVDLYGQQARMPELAQLCKRYNLILIQDAAQSFGSKLNDQPVGKYADFAIYSFYPAKNLGCFGDGGAVSGTDMKILAQVKKLRNHGRTEKYIHTDVGYNERLDGIQAAILCAKLPSIDKWNASRRSNAEFYNKRLKHLPLVLPAVRTENYHVYNQYAILSDSRDELKQFLLDKGIQAGIQFPLGCHQQPSYGSSTGLPHTEIVASKVLSLPVFPMLTQTQIDYVADTIELYFESK